MTSEILITPKEQYVRRALHLFKNGILIFCVVHIPEMFPDLLKSWLVTQIQPKSSLALRIGGVAGLLWFMLLVSFWALATTYLIATRFPQVSLSQAIHQTNRQLARLAMAATVLAPLLTLGLYAYIFPAIIVATLYLFVPILIVTNPDITLMAQFHRSWKLSLLKPYHSFGIVFFSLAVQAALELVVEGTPEGAGESFVTLLTERWPQFLISSVLGVLIGAFISVVVSAYFDSLNPQSEARK